MFLNILSRISSSNVFRMFLDVQLSVIFHSYKETGSKIRFIELAATRPGRQERNIFNN